MSILFFESVRIGGVSMDIIDLIPIGKANAIHQKELAAIMGVSRDTVKAKVREARKDGAEILSGSCGYYFAKDDEERREFVALLSKQAYTRIKTTKPVKCTLNKIKGQMSFTESFEGIYEEGV